ncbi:unnamed protein product [Brassica napus]|uniref:(rape) hypothetical protein n=1 Tax=Brassica napus TaxID=3708 RepID=A0A816M2X2_BRANA|nr:unnamed protein product [Brassica napus]
MLKEHVSNLVTQNSRIVFLRRKALVDVLKVLSDTNPDFFQQYLRKIQDQKKQRIRRETWRQLEEIVGLKGHTSASKIKGTLPQNLVFPNLAAFDLSSNNFQGPFPRWTTYATELHLYQNNFSGSLPPDIHVMMPRLKNIKLFHNSFTGEIPSSLCELTGLETLNLRNNRFSGSFPKCWRPSSEL